MLSGQGRSANSQQTHEMTVPNELIGCIIGKGGSKVAEIRYNSVRQIQLKVHFVPAKYFSPQTAIYALSCHQYTSFQIEVSQKFHLTFARRE